MVQSIPDVARRCEPRFGMKVEAPMTNTRGTMVFLANRANRDVVLKIGLNELDMMRECDALRAFSGRGAIRVLDFDASLKALLLERALPEGPLSGIIDDDRATTIFCTVFQRLHPVRVTHARPSIQEHFSALSRYHETWADDRGPLPARWVDRSLDYLTALIVSTRHTTVLPSLARGNESSRRSF